MGGEFGVWPIPLKTAIRVRGEADCKLRIADCGLIRRRRMRAVWTVQSAISNSQSAIRNRGSEAGTNEPKGAAIEGQDLWPEGITMMVAGRAAVG